LELAVEVAPILRELCERLVPALGERACSRSLLELRGRRGGGSEACALEQLDRAPDAFPVQQLEPAQDRLRPRPGSSAGDEEADRIVLAPGTQRSEQGQRSVALRVVAQEEAQARVGPVLGQPPLDLD